ncbi:uncharacterized protein LOC143032176 [Oratosquilla oratoria]|uniref:uncharacterized protein LOC143032176 n=1 Tax=Oratosquilla oratoria TaxID=337810 RepID=UPI003F763D37
MVGSNVPEASEPWEVVHAEKVGDPYAVRTRLGWVICGRLTDTAEEVAVNSIKVAGNYLDQKLIESYNREFVDSSLNSIEPSVEDRKWLQFVESGCKQMTNGKYEIPLPMKEKPIIVPDSEPMAFERLQRLKRKFKDDEYYRQYNQFMINLLDKGYAEEVPTCDVKNQQAWYIPHFGVRHPTKSNRVRVVFDCAARVNDLSLDDLLRQGPDISDLLSGVLLRFRLGLHAYIADIETMYYQVKVSEGDRDYLRFLWWKDGQIGDIIKLRMTSHPFGACCSPSIAKCAIKRIVQNYGDQLHTSVSEIVLNNFYVDDLLVSSDDINDLIDTTANVIDLCRKDKISISLDIDVIPNTKRELLDVIGKVYDSLRIELAYGSVAYLRYKHVDGKIQCSFILGKAKVAPLKPITIPRLELVAATLAIKLKSVIVRELPLQISQIYIWTDSTTVLKYLGNEHIRFKTFVANRVSQIRENSEDVCWMYVASKDNPADDAMRGRQTSRWSEGPIFLSQNEEMWPDQPEISKADLSNLEIKKVFRVKAELKQTDTANPVMLQLIKKNNFTIPTSNTNTVSSFQRPKGRLSAAGAAAKSSDHEREILHEGKLEIPKALRCGTDDVC